MQQLSRVCMIADHEQRQIEYYCMYPECNLSRFVCSKCLKIGTHKHSQQDQSHILDNQELHKVLQEKLNQKQNSILQTQNQGLKFQAEGLQKIIKECKTLFNSIRNIIEQMEIFMEQNNSLEENQLLERLKKNGFNQIDDIQLNILMNIEKQFDIFTQISEQSHEIIQNTRRLQEWCSSQQSLLKTLYFNKYKLMVQDTGESRIFSSAISNDLKYIVGGGNQKILKIWNYNNNELIKTIQLDDFIFNIKFTDDSKFLYVGVDKYLYQFDVDNNFKQTYKQDINLNCYSPIICITNTIVLVYTTDKTIIKTDILEQQIQKIIAHEYVIVGLDYNNDLNVIASLGFFDKYIKIWNGNNGQLVLQKKFMNEYNYKILFMMKGKQLICQDNSAIIIYKINYETKQLEQQQLIIEFNIIFNISLVLNQQYISLVCREHIKIYSIKGNLIRQFNHGANDLLNYRHDDWYQQLFCNVYYNIIQPPSIQAFIILGEKNFWILKQDID